MKNQALTPRNAVAMVALLTLLALTATAALAERPGPGRRGGGDGFGFGPGLAALQLDLSEEQTASIEKIRDEGREKAVGLRKQMMLLRNELEGEMLTDEPSRKKVLDLNQKMGEVRTQLQANRLEHRLAVREVLTPEQRDRMLLMKEDGRWGRAGRSGMRHEGMRAGRDGRGPRDGQRFPRPDCPRVED